LIIVEFAGIFDKITCFHSLKKYITMRTMIRLTALLLGLLLSGGVWAQSEELQEASRLMKQGQLATAMDKVNQFLATKPRDAQGQFLKGLILVEQNKTGEAITVFSKLTEEYPELPEPYNNLAVLYASQGQYDKAKTALEMSIRTHPSYATAYENLGDVYAKLASQAYDKALQLDSNNTAALSKLSLIRDLFTGSARPARASAKGDTGRTTPTAPTVVAAAPKNAAESKPAPESKPVETKPTPEPTVKPEVKSAGGDSDDVLNMVRAWAAAWTQKDVDGYLAFYAKDFKTPKAEPRATWESARKQRITAPKTIEVSVDAPKVTLADNGTATVSFRQHYRSDHLKTSSSKTLVLVKSDGKWLIQQERVNN
jgi:tetratricopeptide (TPR) repeat protein